jgi:hypothetical protein
MAAVLLPAAGARLVLILAGSGGILAGLAGWLGLARQRRGRRLPDPARPGRT